MDQQSPPWHTGSMCNETRRLIALGKISDAWNQTRIPLRFPEGLPNLAPLDSVRITDPSTIIRASADGDAELVQRRWSWPGPGGKPVYNFRSEGRNLTEGRCLVVADGFYEFTNPADPTQKRKDKWLFTKKGEDWFGIASLWRDTSEVSEAYTLLTTHPGPDVAPYHSRQIVIVERRDWGRWLDPSVPSDEITRPLPAGSLTVAKLS